MRRSQRDRSGPAGIAKPAGQAGFTLLELLVVVIAIVLLLAIFGPAADKAYEVVERHISRSYLRIIESGVEMYKNDFQDYPPSSSAGNNVLPDGYGADLLYLLMTGYGPDAGNDGTPSGTLNLDDGHNGWGFKLVRRGQVYGPYNGTEELPIWREPNSQTTTRRMFADKWNNPVLYYRYDSTLPGYRPGHNAAGDRPADIVAYASRGGVTGGYYRTDYLLISKGPDTRWQTEAGASRDDITNMEGN